MVPKYSYLGLGRSTDDESHVLLDFCVIFFDLYPEHRQFEQFRRHIHVHDRIEVSVENLLEQKLTNECTDQWAL